MAHSAGLGSVGSAGLTFQQQMHADQPDASLPVRCLTAVHLCLQNQELMHLVWPEYSRTAVSSCNTVEESALLRSCFLAQQQQHTPHTYQRPCQGYLRVLWSMPV
jgi:hypothetical protein